MIRLLTLSVILMAVTQFGCWQAEEPKSKQDPKKTVFAKGIEPVATSAVEKKKTTEVVAEKTAEVEEQVGPVVEKSSGEPNDSKTNKLTTLATDVPEESAVDDLPSVRLIMDGGIEIQKGKEAVRLTSKEAQFVLELLNKIK